MNYYVRFIIITTKNNHITLVLNISDSSYFKVLNKTSDTPACIGRFCIS